MGNYCLELLTFWICIWTVIWRRKEDNLIVIGLFWDVYCKSTLTAFSISTEILWLGQVAGPHWTVYPGLLYWIYAYWWCDIKEDYLMMVNFFLFFFFPTPVNWPFCHDLWCAGKKSGMKSVVVMDGHTNLRKQDECWYWEVWCFHEGKLSYVYLVVLTMLRTLRDF